MRDGNSGVGRHADAGGHARHDLERDSRRAERQRLLGPAAEHEWVSALEPHHLTPGSRMLDQELVDFLLRERAVADRLAGADPQGPFRGQVQQPRARQMVVNDDVGRREQGFAPTGQKPRVTRPGPDQVDFSRTWRRHRRETSLA